MTAKGLPMLPWFTGDFMRSTRGWPLLVRGAYRELLDAQWDMGALPVEPIELQGLIGATDAEWQIIWRYCERKFPILDGSAIAGQCGARANPKLEQVRRDAIEYSQERSESGKRGAAARWAKSDSSAIGSANAQLVAKPIAERMAPSPSPSPSESSLDSSSQEILDISTPIVTGAKSADEPKQKRGTRLPDPFLLTPEMRVWADKEGMLVDLVAVTREFVDYWRPLPGSKGTKLDWIATWRNRVREKNAREKKALAPRVTKTKYETLMEGLENGDE